MLEELHSIDALLVEREIKKAEVIIARALRANPLSAIKAQILIRRARVRLMSARPEEAIDDLLTARSLAPEEFESPSLLELLGDCYFARFELSSVGFAERNDTLQAQRAYRQILDGVPIYANLGWIHYQLGRILLTNNEAADADAYFRKALFSPSHVRGLTAYCYERLGFVAFYEHRDSHSAITFLNKAVDTYPSSENRAWLVQAHILRSRVYREARNYGMALTAAEAALAVAADHAVDSKSGLAEALLTAGELLAEIDGRERDVVAYLQQFLQISKKPLGVDVTWSRVHEMLGDAYSRLGQADAAAAAFHAALQFNPYHPWEVSLHYRIARSYYQQQQYEKAIEAIHRMLAAAQSEGQTVGDYRVYDVLGNAQFALGRYAEAIDAYQIALEIAPTNAENLDKIKMYHQFAQELKRPL